MDALKAPISYSQILDWGGARFVPERTIRKWMGGRDEMTIGEALTRPIEPWVVLWVALRENFMTERAMHEAALRLAQALLDALGKKGKYVDFRCAKLLEAKRRWLDGQISLGELRVAQLKGERMCEEIVELESRESLAAAEAAWHAVNDDGAGALRGVYGVADALDGRLKGRRERLRIIAGYLRKREE